MFKSIQAIATLTLALLAGASQAAPVLLGSITHDYGKAAGLSSGGYTNASCVKNGYVIVSDQASSCGNSRFSDTFNFSSFNAASVSSLKLTLTFSSTNDIAWFLGFIPLLEDWKVRPASGNVGSGDLFDLARTGNALTQTFLFDAGNLDLFADIVAKQSFGLWFAEESLGSHQFNLQSAKLDVVGTAAVAAVPEPTGLALASLALIALGAVRRRKQR